MSEAISTKYMFSVPKEFAFGTELTLKSGKSPYVEGYVTTEDIDLQNELMTESAQDMIVAEMKGGQIKLDVEHSLFKSSEPDIPIGRIIDARKEKSMGKSRIWVKALINQAHSKFEEVWKSITNGMIDAFSVAYKTQETENSTIQGKGVTLLKSVKILNVALTGNPVNQSARIEDFYMKSLKAQSSEFPIKEFSKGLKVEMEHAETVDNNPITIAKIVLDHLDEDLNYYDKLEQVESGMETKSVSMKHRYVKREGGPGNYTYIYPEDLEGGKQGSSKEEGSDKKESKKEPENKLSASGEEKKKKWVMAILANDENSTDSEMMGHFMKEGKMSEKEAKHYVKQRDAIANGDNDLEDYEPDGKESKEDKKEPEKKKEDKKPSTEMTQEQIDKIHDNWGKEAENAKPKEYKGFDAEDVKNDDVLREDIDEALSVSLDREIELQKVTQGENGKVILTYNTPEGDKIKATLHPNGTIEGPEGKVRRENGKLWGVQHSGHEQDYKKSIGGTKMCATKLKSDAEEAKKKPESEDSKEDEAEDKVEFKKKFEKKALEEEDSEEDKKEDEDEKKKKKDEMKSMQNEIASLKSLVADLTKKLDEPVLKSFSNKVEVKNEPVQTKSILSLIR